MIALGIIIRYFLYLCLVISGTNAVCFLGIHNVPFQSRRAVQRKKGERLDIITLSNSYGLDGEGSGDDGHDDLEGDLSSAGGRGNSSDDMNSWKMRLEQKWQIYRTIDECEFDVDVQSCAGTLCSSCRGSGATECKFCSGTGFFVVGDHLYSGKGCPVCNGSGEVSCSRCGGSGYRARWVDYKP